MSIQKILIFVHTIRKVKFLSKNSIFTKPQHFHEFFNPNFFDNFSCEIKVVNSKKVQNHNIFKNFSPKKNFDNFLGKSTLNCWTKNEDFDCGLWNRNYNSLYIFFFIFQVVHVSSTMQRTFTKEHWGKLHSLLTGWKGNLHTIREQIGQLAVAQIDLMRETQNPTAAAAAVAATATVTSAPATASAS